MENNCEGEVKRVNLIYFLSHSGHIDNPHLLRIQHLSSNGVFLRDVKRRLAEARGDSMPDAFSWSCKRRYKNGYVWQDLIDDDLITPISDNEYVLKGSEIILSSSKEDSHHVEKKACGTRNDGDVGINHKEYPVFWSQRSTATTSTVTGEIDGPTENGSGKDMESGRPSVSSTTSSSSYMKSKSYSNARVSHVLRNLMKCGGLDANDGVLVPLNKSTSSRAWEDERRYQYQQHNARKSFEGAWSGIKMKETIEFCKPKVASSKPSTMAPLCSQCGKLFKPEKMHSHMKRCRGMKNDSMSGNNTIKPRQPKLKNILENPLRHQRVVTTTLKD